MEHPSESPSPPDQPQHRFLLAPFALVTSTGAAFCFLHRAVIPEWDPFRMLAYLRGVHDSPKALGLTLAYYLPWLLPGAYAAAFRLVRRLSPGAQWELALACVVALMGSLALWPGGA